MTVFDRKCPISITKIPVFILISADNTIYWSPDGSTILFASYDLENVQLLEYNTYGGPYKKVEKMDDRYPITRQIKYAKVIIIQPGRG